MAWHVLAGSPPLFGSANNCGSHSLHSSMKMNSPLATPAPAFLAASLSSCAERERSSASVITSPAAAAVLRRSEKCMWQRMMTRQ